MLLECDITDDPGIITWWYATAECFAPLDTARARRCRSCNRLIKPGDQALKFTRWRPTRDWVEYKIYGEGEEVDLAPWWHCEQCGEIYLNLWAAGFCPDIDTDMRKALVEYQRDYAHPAWESFRRFAINTDKVER
jgi:hypothetical protein